jgi:hypothetical protein
VLAGPWGGGIALKVWGRDEKAISRRFYRFTSDHHIRCDHAAGNGGPCRGKRRDRASIDRFYWFVYLRKGTA